MAHLTCPECNWVYDVQDGERVPVHPPFSGIKCAGSGAVVPTVPFQGLPLGTSITLIKVGDSKWTGTLVCDPVTTKSFASLEAEASSVVGLIKKLAERFFGRRVRGKL